MGLDNGIILKLKEKKLPEDFPVTLDPYEYRRLVEDGEIQVAYWRKCWGIRGVILSALRVDKNGGGEYPIEYDDVQPIIRELLPFLNSKYWDENADSIWEYDEYIEHQIDIILALKWLAKYLAANKDAECYFYDSY